jgi:hypothetical protein
MDQVRTVLHWLKQQHFWVLSGVVALVGLFCWWSASRAMSSKYDANQRAITSQYNNVVAARNAPFLPNQAINEKQEEERKKQLESVTQLWQQLYDRQREDVLKWPTALKQDFRTTVEKKQFNDEIPSELRNHYQDYIDRHFPELPKKIGARIIEDPTATGGAAGIGRGSRFGPEGEGAGFIPGMIPEDDDYICEWLDQVIVREELHFPERPSSLRIWVTQENLWVYHTLLNVIAKSNQAANATRMSNAAVKIVYSLEVGQRAAPYSRQPNRLLKQPPVAAAVPGAGFEGEGGLPAGGPAGAEFGASPRGMGEGGGFGGTGGGAMSPAEEQAFLMSGRYLDDKGPILIGGGAAMEGGLESGMPPDPALATAPAPPLDMAQFGVGFKRLPIRMAMQMDLRWLPQLITNCANEPLRVEVQEVRINPSDLAGAESGGGGFGGGFGGGSRFGAGGFGGERGFGGGGGGFRGGGGGTSDAALFPDLTTGIQNFPAQPHVGNVVIQGIIYIFTKPDMQQLEQASGELAAAPIQ